LGVRFPPGLLGLVSCGTICEIIMVFDVYKRGQGKYTRLCSGFGAALIVGLGCLQLYKKLQAWDLGLWTITMVPVGLFVVLGILIFWLVNKPSVADFMIAAESEMKKVSWSSRKEIAVSTFIVIVLVIILAVFLGITDLGFQMIFEKLLYSI
jgi:preprotein translocase subunit SecE